MFGGYLVGTYLLSRDLVGRYLLTALYMYTPVGTPVGTQLGTMD